MSEQPDNISRALSTIERPAGGWALAVQDMRDRMVAIHKLYEHVMEPEVDYGVIPGTKKPTLYQPGAQMLDMMTGLAARFEELPGCVENWEQGVFYYKVRCQLVSKATGDIAAEGIGSCNSKESRYADRWVWPNEVPAHLDKQTLPKREFQGRDNKPKTKYLVPNEDIYSLVNTLHKMAQKRAHIAATLNATGASRIFTQDVEDLPAEVLQERPTNEAKAAVAPQPKAPQEAPTGKANGKLDAKGEFMAVLQGCSDQFDLKDTFAAIQKDKRWWPLSDQQKADVIAVKDALKAEFTKAESTESPKAESVQESKEEVAF